jgi:copper chaperone CopZ
MHYERNIYHIINLIFLMPIIKYQVSGLTCGGCVNRVKNTLTNYAERAEVTLSPPEATLTNPNSDINELNVALSKVGSYQLSPLATHQETTVDEQTTKNWLVTYKPLLLVFTYILMVTLSVEMTHGNFELHRWMPNFMAGFFIVFSFFKMLDLAGFANSYAMYDLLAKRLNSYGYIYPFIELGLGLGYLLKWQPTFINWITLIVMGFSTIGVVLAVIKKQEIKCACLGTGFNLPMSTVTIIEDLLMVAMAIAMLTTPIVFLH